MRLFTGIALCPTVVNSLSRLLDHLRPAAHVKWCPIYNLHITTSFIGEWPEDRVETLIDALRQTPAAAPIDIAVNGLGWLPNPHNARVLFAAVHQPSSLLALSQAIDQQLLPLGVTRESREFFPHITLARIKESSPLTELKQAIAGLPSVDFGTFTAGSFHLFHSSRGPAGSVYAHLADFPLTGK